MMNRIASLLVILVLVHIGVAQSQSKQTIYNQLRRPPDATLYHVPIGLCEDYPEETTTLKIIRSDMELLKRSGINLLRISFGWDAIEAQRDTYTWGFWDDYVKIATDEYGITLIPYICYTPQWNSSGDSTNFWNHTPRDYQEYGQFVYDLVMRYKRWIKSWELWNEPDIKEYWSGNAADLAKLVKIGSEAVRRADPEAIVVCPGLAHDVNFLRALFRDHKISPYVDVVNMHNYNETWGNNPIEYVTGYVNSIADIVTRWGNNQSLWMAEIGYSTFRKGAHVSDSYSAYYQYEHTPQYQAVQLVKTLALLLSTDKLAAIAWYEIKDLPPQESVIGDINNRNLGVAYVDHSPKPAEKALAFSNKLFSQKVTCIDSKVVVKRAAGSESEIHCFENEDGSIIVVAWLKTHIFGKRVADQTGMVKDVRREKIALSIPLGLSGQATQFDELGNGTKFGGVKASAMTTTIDDIPLVGGQIFIVKINK